MATKKILKLARSCKELFAIVDTEYRREFPEVGGSRVTNSVLFGFAFDRMHNLFGVIDWAKLSRMSVFAPDEIDCPDIRYTSSLTLPTTLYPSVNWAALETFRASRKSDFVGIRRNVYIPFCVKLILTSFALDLRHELPLLVAGGEELPADAPAAFNPSELLSGSASRAADPARKKHMTFARIDPSIFDQSDLFPNGKVDAEGFADASEMF